MSSYTGLYVQRHSDGTIFKVQAKYSGGEIPLDPQIYISRGARPPIDQLPDIEEYDKKEGPGTNNDPRIEFLVGVHEESGGDTSRQVNAASIAQKLGMDEHGLRRVTQYLAGEELIEVPVTLHRIPTFVKITHRGVKALEAGKLG